MCLLVEAMRLSDSDRLQVQDVAIRREELVTHKTKHDGIYLSCYNKATIIHEEENIQDFSSPQSKALCWILNNNQ